jgi:pimeloyl-ACP methyl ester carboxylesterase
LIDAVQPGKARIVGHDWGGALAWHLAATRPEHTERLAVLNCPHPTRMREALVTKPSLSQLKKSWYMFMFQLPLIPELALTRNDGAEIARSLKAMSFDRTNFTDEELRPFRDGVQKPGAASAMLGWYRAMMREGLFGKPIKYPTIEVDTLLIWGMEDKALGFDDLVPGTEQFAPKVKIAQIPGCGHFVQSEQPAKVNAALLPFLRA